MGCWLGPIPPPLIGKAGLRSLGGALHPPPVFSLLLALTWPLLDAPPLPCSQLPPYTLTPHLLASFSLCSLPAPSLWGGTPLSPSLWSPHTLVPCLPISPFVCLPSQSDHLLACVHWVGPRPPMELCLTCRVARAGVGGAWWPPAKDWGQSAEAGPPSPQTSTGSLWLPRGCGLRAGGAGGW